MAADLHIHIKTDDIKDKNMEVFFGSSIGSKYFKGFFVKQMSWEEEYKLSEPIKNSPSIWVGEVSWLKAGLIGDDEEYIPGTVAKVSELIGEKEPIIDDELITKIGKAFTSKNTTGYSIAKKSDVIKFLKEHKGKKIFTVSW